MRTQEIFYKPGFEPASVVFESLPPTPREIHPIGMRYSLIWRMAVIIVAVNACVFSTIYHFNQYIQTANFLYWFIIIVLIPICILFIPWCMISTYLCRIRSFNYYKNIYQNGLAAMGSITIMTQITGTDHDSHLIKQNWRSPFSKVRVDYTFFLDNVLHTGTVLLKSQTVDYLSINTEVCVLYLPEDPSQNMLFPIPGNEFFNLNQK